MGGGTLQLVAYGGQDIHIIGNPEMSFFKSVYRRHTNFAMECIKQPMLGPIRSEAFKASFKLGRDGDLINKMHLQIKLPEQKNLLLTKGQGIDRTKFTVNMGTNILSHINIINAGSGYIYGATIKIGGQNIDNARVVINSSNGIDKIIINDRSSEYGSGAPSVIIEGNCDPSLKTGVEEYDNNLKKFGSNASAEAIISENGIKDITNPSPVGNYFRKPETTSSNSSYPPALETIISNNNGEIVKINVLRSGEYESGTQALIEINETYTNLPSILTDISNDENDVQETSGTTSRKNAWISYQNQPAYCYIKDIELKIGEQSIDKHTGQYYDIHDTFFDKEPENIDYLTGKNNIVGQWPPKDNIIGNISSLVPREIDLLVPLKFWFTKNTGQSLPMIALQYHDVNIDINFRDLREIMIWHAGHITPTPTGGINNSIHHLEFTEYEKLRIFSREILKPEIELWANYIYLDTDERKRFAKSGHEYLIEQVQTIKDRYKKNVNIHFNHSVKTLFWVIQGKNCSIGDIKFKNSRHELSNDTVSNNWNKQKLYTPYNSEPGDNPVKNNGVYINPPEGDFTVSIKSKQASTALLPWLQTPTFDYTIVNNNENGFTQNNNYLFYDTHQGNINKSFLNYREKQEHFKTCKIIMNGIDRIQERNSLYFRTIQPHENNLMVPKKNIYMYSFSLDPLKHQPTGTCNFSKLDSAQLEFEGEQNYANYDINIYAQNYNILRIMEGMGGLLYNS